MTTLAKGSFWVFTHQKTKLKKGTAHWLLYNSKTNRPILLPALGSNTFCVVSFDSYQLVILGVRMIAEPNIVVTEPALSNSTENNEEI